jgi:hypothetical protein
MSKQLFVASLIVFAGSPAHAAVIATWTFETSQPAQDNTATLGPISPEIGAGVAAAVHVSSATDYSTPAGNGSSHSFNSNTWAVGDHYQFQVSTAGLSGIFFEFDQTRSATGPGTWDFQYSTDGTAFTTFLNDYTVLENAPAWSSAGARQSAYTFSLDLSGVPALNNDSSVFFRITAASAPSSSVGTARVDNVSISSADPIAVVPEPSTLALFSLATLGGAGLLRRRAKVRSR